MLDPNALPEARRRAEKARKRPTPKIKELRTEQAGSNAGAFHTDVYGLGEDGIVYHLWGDIWVPVADDKI